VAAKRKVEFSERMPASKAALYLELIASGLRKGSAYLDPRDLSVQFEMPAELDFDMTVKVRPRKARGKLAIELAWSLNEDAQADPSLRVASADDEA
jgi:amphi-Trp domain-containing protein